ncbi:MAG: hypothetical protein M3028_07685, partial [Bifidobacterium sp.]|nr:hypothetical protein [Bifidobacterium sp.]
SGCRLITQAEDGHGVSNEKSNIIVPHGHQQQNEHSQKHQNEKRQKDRCRTRRGKTAKGGNVAKTCQSH